MAYGEKGESPRGEEKTQEGIGSSGRDELALSGTDSRREQNSGVEAVWRKFRHGRLRQGREEGEGAPLNGYVSFVRLFLFAGSGSLKSLFHLGDKP